MTAVRTCSLPTLQKAGVLLLDWQEFTSTVDKCDAELHLPEMNQLRPALTLIEDVNELLDIVVSRGSHVMANRLLAALRKLFNWCVSRGVISTSPCAGISAPHREKARDRVLSDAELVSVIDAARKIEGAFSGIIQILVLTAQRRGEVSEMTWDELDLDKGLWTIPGERTKNGKPHFVHAGASRAGPGKRTGRAKC